MGFDVEAITAALSEKLSSSEDNRFYAVVDGARCVDLAYEAKLVFGKEIRSLFADDIQPLVWHVAPYLVPIDPGSTYLSRWAERWGQSAGVLIVSASDPDRLYSHLRKIFVVTDDQRQSFFFRFYDPRVLRNFLETCTRSQLTELFGPISEFIVEGVGSEILSFRCGTDHPSTRGEVVSRDPAI